MRQGQAVRTHRGRRLHIGRPLGGGGEGSVFEASMRGSRSRYVAKVFRARHPELVRRTQYLVKKDLPSLCPAIVAPIDTFEDNGEYGHIAPLAPGEEFSELTQMPALIERIQAGLVLATAVDVLHRLGIAHGDLNPRNVLWEPKPHHVRVYLIDLDGFSCPEHHTRMVGAQGYMAPELFRAMRAKQQPTVDRLACDRYSLAVLLHEILLCFHPAGDESDGYGPLLDGRWPFDPMRPTAPAGQATLPVECLNAHLISLFQQAFGPSPHARPPASAWVKALSDALWSVWACSKCSRQSVIETTRRACPHCHHPYPTLTLHVQGRGTRIELRNPTIKLGRDDLAPDDLLVSRRHLVIRRYGPEYRLQVIGRNGAARRVHGKQWFQLPRGREVVIEPGNDLRVGKTVLEFR